MEFPSMLDRVREADQAYFTMRDAPVNAAIKRETLAKLLQGRQSAAETQKLMGLLTPEQQLAVRTGSKKLADVLDITGERKNIEALQDTIPFILSESRPEDVRGHLLSAEAQLGPKTERLAAIKAMTEVPKDGKTETRKLALTGDMLVDQEKVDGRWVNVGAPYSRFAKQVQGDATKTPAQLFREEQEARKDAEKEQQRAKVVELKNNALDNVLTNIDDLIDEEGNPRPGFNDAFGQWDALYPNFMKFDKTSRAYKTGESIRSQETMRGLSDAKAAVGQSFGSMQVKEWDKFTNLVRNLDLDQPQDSLREQLKRLRTEALKLKGGGQSSTASSSATADDFLRKRGLK